MRSKIFGILKYLIFLGLGIFIFWYIYRKYDMEEIVSAFKEVNYFWILASLVFSFFSVVARAMRWRMLIDSIGHKTRFINVFLSCYVLYLVNLMVPRAGEVARCTIVSGTDRVPFAKLFGTMIVERLADLLMLVILAILIFLTNLATINLFFDAHPSILDNVHQLLSLRNMILGMLVLIFLAGLFIYIRRRKKASKVRTSPLWKKLIEGIYSISKVKNKWLFVGYTAFIYLMWLSMLYVVFLAYPPTAHLSVRTGMVVFLMGGLAMIAPIPGGMGAWNWMVYQTLFIYGIAYSEGEIFALIAFAATNLIYIVFGAVALLILVMSNSGRVHLRHKSEQ